MTVRIAGSVLSTLLRLFTAALARGVEMHAYAVGRRVDDVSRVEAFVSVPPAKASAAIVQPDYGEAGLALEPYLADGLHVLGEVHSHLSFVGPSGGDIRTLHEISDAFPGYLCLVIAPGRDAPVITAHSVIDGALKEHAVINEEYSLLGRSAVATKQLFIVGAGSGTAAALPQLLKFGFAGITIADEDILEERNIDRHLADRAAIGTPKVANFEAFAAGRTTSRIRTLQLALRDATVGRFEREITQHDVIFNGTGHLLASRRLSHLARRHQKPVVHAGVFPRGSGGFVFLDTPRSACYSCLFELHLDATADDAETMATLTRQYGLTEEQLSAQLGLWPDVNMIASLHVKVLLEYLKGTNRHNLYLIDNEHLTIEHRTIARRSTCICNGGTQ